MSDWTDELKQEVIEAYEGRNPTPENSVEIVKELADEYDKTPNGLRMILTKAGVYVKATPSASKAANSGEEKAPRVSKADSQQALKDIIESQGIEADYSIIDKLTGKAAVYLTTVINKIVKND